VHIPGIGRPAGGRFWSYDLATSAVTPINTLFWGSNLGSERSFSPDGSVFAYASYGTFSACGHTSHYSLVNMHDQSGFDLYPMGGALPVLVPEGSGYPEISESDYPGFSERELGWNYYPPVGLSWSPDSQRLALAVLYYYGCWSEARPVSNLFIVSRTGSSELVAHGAFPSWAPAGDRLAYQSAWGLDFGTGRPSNERPIIRVRELASGRERDLGEGTRPAWQPTR
jgi:Tol biopolymer transport system component